MRGLIRSKVGHYSRLQQRYLLKDLMGGFTKTLIMAALTLEIVGNFDASIVLLRDYLMPAPALLILIPFIKKWIDNNPISCYRIKGTISVLGLAGLLVVEIMDGSKVWYLVDAGLVSLTALLMMPHRAYYKSSVVNKCKEYSSACGYIEMLNNISYVVLGLAIVYFSIPTIWLLALGLPFETFERWLENRCVQDVYGEKPNLVQVV